MRRCSIVVAGIVAACCPPEPAKKPVVIQPKPGEWRELALPDEPHLKNLRELTFGADNAEAYWSFSGDRLIFQTNRAPYKCDQIEMIPSSGGASKLISTGKGRTTCSYFMKGDQEIIYASTHEASAECPTPPDMSKGYYWGLFDYEIYRANADGTNLRKLTDAHGYNAEATVCPIDGSIVFTSTRSGDLELWRMDADGGHLLQLTNTLGYDGGAVWSPDCTKIAWRASRPTTKEEVDSYKELLAQKLVKPTKMDLWVANADGTEAHQITYLPGASFGPFFYPDGKRLIFASNYLAPRGPEFDLFGIGIDGTHLERITTAPSFDGFPMFSPDGKKLSFSSNRRDVDKRADGKDVYRMHPDIVAGEHDTNVFVADWKEVEHPTYQPETAAADRYAETVAYLAAPEREGRGIGTAGLRAAADYVQKQLEAAGVEVTRQTFEMTVAIERGASAVELDGKPLAADEFTPMPYSASKTVAGAIVPVGWGIVDADAKLDDYKGKDVRGKLALVHRFAPDDDKRDPKATARLGDLRVKALQARQRGAIGLVVVDDGDAKKDEAPLPRLAHDGMAEVMTGGADAGVPIVVVKRAVGAKLATGAHRGKLAIALAIKRAPTDNVVGVIRAGSPSGGKRPPGVVVIGAHVDHLGMGGGSNALDPEVHAVHGGADDNASGVAALIEAARAVAAAKDKLDRDVYVVAFSGEESGDIGSQYFVKHPPTTQPIVAMINMDMVGRMRNGALHVHGGDTAKEWRELVEPACVAARVTCTIGGSGYGPSDHMPFYVAGVPVLFLFTGNHLDYHTAHDTADKINAAGGARTAAVVAQVALGVANRPQQLTYVKAPPEQVAGDVRRKGASLGTVPSYGEDPNQPPGLVLSDVLPEGPAQKAGLKGGDRIVAIGTIEIRNINDLMFVLETAKPGTPTTITFVRNGKRQTVDATFGAPRARK